MQYVNVTHDIIAVLFKKIIWGFAYSIDNIARIQAYFPVIVSPREPIEHLVTFAEAYSSPEYSPMLTRALLSNDSQRFIYLSFITAAV
jgi:hypothetical protein